MTCFFLFLLFLENKKSFWRRLAMAVAIAVDMDAGAMAAEKMAARKPNPATNGLGSGSHESKEPGASPNFFDLVAANHFFLMYSQVAAHATGTPERR